jgi:hypothetical protein
MFQDQPNLFRNILILAPVPARTDRSSPRSSKDLEGSYYCALDAGTSWYNRGY